MAINLQEAFETEPSEPDFVLPGFLAGTVGILTSAGGVGKSFWMMEAALGIASPAANAALLRLPIATHGTAVILNSEDPADMLKRRLHAIGAHLDQDARQEVVAGMVIEDLFGRGTDIMDLRWQTSIRDMLLRNRARICVLDTLSRWHRMDENSNADMGRLMAILEHIARDTGTAMVLIHHVAKSMAINGRQDEQQSARGASLLVDNARWQAWMAGMTAEDAKRLKVDQDQRGYFARFGISKQNYGQPYAEQWLRRHEGGVLKPADLEEKWV